MTKLVGEIVRLLAFLAGGLTYPARCLGKLR